MVAFSNGPREQRAPVSATSTGQVIVEPHADPGVYGGTGNYGDRQQDNRRIAGTAYAHGALHSGVRPDGAVAELTGSAGTERVVSGVSNAQMASYLKAHVGRDIEAQLGGKVDQATIDSVRRTAEELVDYHAPSFGGSRMFTPGGPGEEQSQGIGNRNELGQRNGLSQQNRQGAWAALTAPTAQQDKMDLLDGMFLGQSEGQGSSLAHRGATGLKGGVANGVTAGRDHYHTQAEAEPRQADSIAISKDELLAMLRERLTDGPGAERGSGKPAGAAHQTIVPAFSTREAAAATGLAFNGPNTTTSQGATFGEQPAASPEPQRRGDLYHRLRTGTETA